MVAPRQALARVHMMICCPGASSTLSNHYEIYLNSFSFSTNCYKKWILNTFTYFWCFLEHFIGKFIPNINNEHAQDCSCPGKTFAFCSHGKSYLGKASYPVLYNGNKPLEVAPRQWKTHVNSYRRQRVHRGKVDPGVSELPWGNELSRDYVNRPWVYMLALSREEGYLLMFL